jgi:hypothetical protein
MMTKTLCGRITLGDDSIERLLNGETLTFDMRPDTKKIQVRLHEGSKYLMDIMSQQRAPGSDVDWRRFLAPGRRL